MTSPDKDPLTEQDDPTAPRPGPGPIPRQGGARHSASTAQPAAVALDESVNDRAAQGDPDEDPHVDPADDPTEHPAEDSANPLDLLPAEPVSEPRRSWWWALTAAVVVVALCVGAFWWNSTRQRPAPPAAAPPAAQHGLFLAVSDPDGKLVDGLYYVDGETSAGVFVPGDLLLDAPSLGTAPLSDVLPLGTDVPGVAFSDATGLRVDASWAVPMDGLAALIDKVGGVSVDVDVPVQAGAVNITAGPGQKLDGTHALTFATWTGTGEAPSAQLARLGQVTSTLISSLPSTADDIEGLLEGVPGSTTLSTAELAERLLQQRTALLAENPASTLLPVTDSPTPQVPTGVSVDNAALGTFMGAHASGVQVRRPGVNGNVALQNASGVEALELNARRLLVDAGFSFSWRGLAEPAQEATIVLVPTADKADLDLGRRVAKDLGLPQAQVVAAPAIVPVGQDAMVLLGADFSAVDITNPTASGPQTPAEQAAPDQTPAEPATEPAPAEQVPAEPAPAEQAPAEQAPTP